MKKMQLILSISALTWLAACGQSVTQQNSSGKEVALDIIDTAPTTELESEEKNEVTQSNAKEIDVQDKQDFTVVSTTENAVAVSKTETASKNMKPEPNTKDEVDNITDEELGVDEVAPPSYEDAQDQELQQKISELTSQFETQLLAIQLESGNNLQNVYAVITDGLKLPSDEEREFHVIQMTEVILESLQLEEQAPNGLITFVYEDQSVLAVYDTQTKTFNWSS